MTMEFDHDSRMAARTGNHPAEPSDWHALHARLAAGYAVRPALERRNARGTTVAGGSFDSRSARMLAVFGRDLEARLDAINSTALGSGNSNYDNDAAVAGAHAAGD
jgi:hypothetical protein